MSVREKLLLMKNLVKPVGWAISHLKYPTYDCHFELQADSLNWPRFIEIGEIA